MSFGIIKSAESRWQLSVVLAFVILLESCGTATPPRLTVSKAAEEGAIRQMLAGVEKRINAGDLGFVEAFAKDAIIVAPGSPDVSGVEAITAMYSGLLKQASVKVHFSTEEITIADDLAVERGTYSMVVADRASGRTLQDVKNKHIHILRKQPDGSWKTWRMMVNSAEPSGDEKTSK